MKLWTSSEAWREASEDCSLLRNLIVDVVNEKLANFQMDGVDVWSVITIILPDNIQGYGEIQKFHKKEKDIEYRLKIDYQDFSKSDYPGKAQLIFDMLLRSIDLMADKKIPKQQLDELRKICLSAFEQIKQIGNLKKTCLEMHEKYIAESRKETKIETLEKAKAKFPEKAKAKEIYTSFLKENPVKIITISSFEDLCKIGKEAAYPLDGSYELACDIDASGSRQANNGQGFEPIGSCVVGEMGEVVLECPFTGMFDGKGFTIKGLYISQPKSDCVGLFGYAGKRAHIIDINVDVNVTGKDRVGGLVGFNDMCIITGCSVIGEVNGIGNVGGLAGFSDGMISGCNVAANVNGKGNVGCLAGFSRGIIRECSSEGDVNGIEEIGGLVGFNGGKINVCYATGAVKGNTSDVGGLAGCNVSGVIADCYATGAVKGRKYVGGLVGNNIGGTIAQCYSTGNVKGKDYFGGLVGSNKNWKGRTDGTVSDCFWDVSASGLAKSDGGTGKNTAQMKKRNTYEEEDWNFHGTWQMDELGGYPVFCNRI